MQRLIPKFKHPKIRFVIHGGTITTTTNNSAQYGMIYYGSKEYIVGSELIDKASLNFIEMFSGEFLKIYILQENMIEAIPKQATNIFHRIGFENPFKQRIVLICIRILAQIFIDKVIENIKESLLVIKT